MKALGARVLAMPTPVWVVGTYDEEGKPNVMTAAWGAYAALDPSASMFPSGRLPIATGTSWSGRLSRSTSPEWSI